jgi:hypothetical protein
MSLNGKKLYELLPAIHRIRDEEQGGQLRELLSVIASQVDLLDEDMAQLYDDFFIETCADWVVPYIGDLLGYRSLHEVTPNISSPRAEVANTIGYRRRKGTLAMLEQLAHDVTGWDARVVEFFQILATTQYMNHLRPENLNTPDLRRWEPLEYLDTPFDSLSHTVDVRRIERERGKYNIPNIGIFIWSLGAYPLTDSPACSNRNGRYFFSPLGNDIQLFTKPVTEDEVTHLAEPVNVPMPISRRVLDHHLNDYYGPEKSIFIRAGGTEIRLDQIVVCDLSDIAGGKWAHEAPEEDINTGKKARVAIDPILGRIAFPGSLKPENDDVKVTFHYGFSAAMGGGEYSRYDSFDADLALLGQPVKVPGDYHTIQDALDNLNQSGVIEITDSGRYEGTLEKHLAKGVHIELRAAEKCRPTVIIPESGGGGPGKFEISGDDDSEMILNGLLVSGGYINVPATYKSGASDKPNKLRYLTVKHCTLVPGLDIRRQINAPSLIVESSDISIDIEDCITGGLRIAGVANISITNSIVDSTSESNVAYKAPGNDGDGKPGGILQVVNSTIIGKVNASMMELVSNTIFMARLKEKNEDWDTPVLAQRQQEGCVRFSFLPSGSRVPRRYHCVEESESDASLRPMFTSGDYSDPGYCQLSRNCAIEIRQGADDESEMGVFHDLYQQRREINLRVRLGEYLRFGLEAGIFYLS